MAGTATRADLLSRPGHHALRSVCRSLHKVPAPLAPHSSQQTNPTGRTVYVYSLAVPILPCRHAGAYYRRQPVLTGDDSVMAEHTVSPFGSRAPARRATRSASKMNDGSTRTRFD